MKRLLQKSQIVFTIALAIITSSCNGTEISSKLAPFELKGRVKSVIISNNKTDDEIRISFDEDGIAIPGNTMFMGKSETKDGVTYVYRPLNSPLEDEWDKYYTYDRQGRLASISNWGGITYYYYDSNNRPVKTEYSGEGDPDSYYSIYTYGDDGYLKTITDISEGVEFCTTHYEIMNKDGHGNWTERKCAVTSKWFGDKTFMEVREIQYW